MIRSGLPSDDCPLITASWIWWSRRVLPPGPKGLLRRPFIAIAGLHQHLEYKRKWLSKKDRRNEPGRVSGGKNRCESKHFDEFPSRIPFSRRSKPRTPQSPPSRRRPGTAELFTVFAAISLSGFGGVLASIIQEAVQGRFQEPGQARAACAVDRGCAFRRDRGPGLAAAAGSARDRAGEHRRRLF